MADALNASNLDTCYDAPVEVAAKRDGGAAEDGEGNGESGVEIEWVSVYREGDSCSSVTCGVVVGVALSAVCVWGVITLLPHEATVEEIYATQRQAG